MQQSCLFQHQFWILVNKQIKHYLKYYNISVTIVATKCDKVSKNSYDKNIRVIRDSLNMVDSDELIMFSMVNKTGRQEVIDKINSLI